MVIEKDLKSITIRESGRSSDYIFPTIIQGCFGQCLYCYAARHNPEDFYNNIKISNNLDQIINKVKSYPVNVIKPNQTHDKYVTWDIACNADIVSALHLFPWEKLFDYFKYSDRDFGTFATKFVNHKLLKYNPDRKIRVRITLTPEVVNTKTELNTASTLKRVNFINKLYDAGYEVHLNFSPVIYYNNWLEDYEKLFKLINLTTSNEVKDQLKCEVIFLTHNESLHNYNMVNHKDVEKVLWVPELQENKVSGFGGKNVRYEFRFKKHLIEQFKELLNKHLPYCEVRYIF